MTVKALTLSKDLLYTDEFGQVILLKKAISKDIYLLKTMLTNSNYEQEKSKLRVEIFRKFDSLFIYIIFSLTSILYNFLFSISERNEFNIKAIKGWKDVYSASRTAFIKFSPLVLIIEDLYTIGKLYAQLINKQEINYQLGKNKSLIIRLSKEMDKNSFYIKLTNKIANFTTYLSFSITFNDEKEFEEMIKYLLKKFILLQNGETEILIIKKLIIERDQHEKDIFNVWCNIANNDKKSSEFTFRITESGKHSKECTVVFTYKDVSCEIKVGKI